MAEAIEYFPVVEGLDIADLDGVITGLSRNPSVDGIFVMSVHTDPLRVRVMFDRAKTGASEIRRWLLVNGVALLP